MLTVKTSDQLEKEPQLFTLVNQRLDDLKRVVNDDPTGHTTAEWDIAVNRKGEQYVVLQLSDSNGKVSGIFSTEDLASSSPTQWHISRLWGDLLGIRSRTMLKDLLDTNAENNNGD